MKIALFVKICKNFFITSKVLLKNADIYSNKGTKIKETGMALGLSSNHLLCLTRQKADLECNISIGNMHKLQLANETTDLAQEHARRSRCKKLAFFANGDYRDISYGYLMGYGSNTAPILSGGQPLKSENSMVLTNYKGQVVLSDDYAAAIKKVVGPAAINKQGVGQPFSTDYIPAIIAELCPGYTAEQVKTVIDGNSLNSSYGADGQSINGTNPNVNINNSAEDTEILQALVDFYYPIFAAAAANGWTTEYNNEINQQGYISDALLSGAFQLMMVEGSGEFEEDTSLNFFTNAGYIETVSDSETREEVNAWYEAEKNRIAEKENILDIQISEWSTTLEAVKVEIKALESYVSDAISSINKNA